MSSRLTVLLEVHWVQLGASESVSLIRLRLILSSSIQAIGKKQTLSLSL